MEHLWLWTSWGRCKVEFKDQLHPEQPLKMHLNRKVDRRHLSILVVHFSSDIVLLKFSQQSSQAIDILPSASEGLFHYEGPAAVASSFLHVLCMTRQTVHTNQMVKPDIWLI